MEYWTFLGFGLQKYVIPAALYLARRKKNWLPVHFTSNIFLRLMLMFFALLWQRFAKKRDSQLLWGACRVIKVLMGISTHSESLRWTLLIMFITEVIPSGCHQHYINLTNASPYKVDIITSRKLTCFTPHSTGCWVFCAIFSLKELGFLGDNFDTGSISIMMAQFESVIMWLSVIINCLPWWMVCFHSLMRVRWEIFPPSLTPRW